MSGCIGPISSVWSGASLYPRLNPEDNCWTFAALTEVPRRGVQRLGTRWGESDSDGISDDQALITSRMRAILLQRGMVLEQELRFHRASRDAHNEGPGIAGCQTVSVLLPSLAVTISRRESLAQ